MHTTGWMATFAAPESSLSVEDVVMLGLDWTHDPKINHPHKLQLLLDFFDVFDQLLPLAVDTPLADYATQVGIEIRQVVPILQDLDDHSQFQLRPILEILEGMSQPSSLAFTNQHSKEIGARLIEGWRNESEQFSELPSTPDIEVIGEVLLSVGSGFWICVTQLLAYPSSREVAHQIVCQVADTFRDRYMAE